MNVPNINEYLQLGTGNLKEVLSEISKGTFPSDYVGSFCLTKRRKL